MISTASGAENDVTSSSTTSSSGSVLDDTWNWEGDDDVDAMFYCNYV